jgi:hypothetical protein
MPTPLQIVLAAGLPIAVARAEWVPIQFKKLDSQQKLLAAMGADPYTGDSLEEARTLVAARRAELIAEHEAAEAAEGEHGRLAIAWAAEDAPEPAEEDDDASSVSSASSASSDSSSDSDSSDDETITIKKSDWVALCARVAALECGKKPLKATKAPKAPASGGAGAATSPKAPKVAAVRRATKDILLTDILTDGETVYSKELVNAGPRKGQHNVMGAVFSAEHKGFTIIDGPDLGWKNPYALSPTTLCSRFRAVMANRHECKSGKSTTCGFAKCYVIREGKEMRLNTLW